MASALDDFFKQPWYRAKVVCHERTAIGFCCAQYVAVRGGAIVSLTPLTEMFNVVPFTTKLFSNARGQMGVKKKSQHSR
jgi:hypothetical protein